MRPAILFLALAASRLEAQCPDGAPPPCAGVRAKPRVRILNFAVADSADAYLAAGIADDVRGALAATRTVTLVGAQARDRDAEYTLRASVRRSAESVIVSAVLERSASRILWDRQLRRPARQVPGIAGEIAAGSLAALGISARVGVESASADPAIYDLFLRGRYQVGRRTAAGLTRALALYREAIARDSLSPLGWVGVARVMERSSRWHIRIPGVPPESLLAIELAAADRAVELAPRDPDVLVMRGQVAQDLDPTNRTASIRAFRAAIALDPDHLEAWKSIAYNYLEVGDHANARLALQRAAALDPDGGQTLAWVSTGWFLMRERDSAAALAERAVAADPTLIGAHGAAGQSALWAGRLAEAETHFSTADRIGLGDNDRVGQYELTRVYVARGDTARARTYVAAAEQLADTLNPSVHAAVALADAQLAAGDTARALWWLERYRIPRDLHFLLHLRGEPAFDGVRTLPRFRALTAPAP